MDINIFKNGLAKYSTYYSPSALFDKIAVVAKKAGVNVVYLALLLYYSATDKNMPMKDRLIVLAALGYFILPLDVIPDLTPILGYTDDMTVLTYAVKQVWGNINSSTKSHAKGRLTEWFGTINPSDLVIPGLN